MAMAAATAWTRARKGPWSERTVSSEASPSCLVSTGRPEVELLKRPCSGGPVSLPHFRRDMLVQQFRSCFPEVPDRARMQGELDVEEVDGQRLPRRRVYTLQKVTVGEDRLDEFVDEVLRHVLVHDGGVPHLQRADGHVLSPVDAGADRRAGQVGHPLCECRHLFRSEPKEPDG